MRALDLEPGVEQFIRRLAPNELGRLEGASDEEIARLEGLAGRPLPRFYKWFLARMGHDTGPFGYPTLDCRPATIASFYEDEIFPAGHRYHLIGVESDDVMPLHLMYDFEHPVRDDARVVKMESIGDPVFPRFETFREMFAWSEFLAHRVQKLPQQCHGLFADDNDGDVLGKLTPVANRFGLQLVPDVPTGPLCSLYDGTEIALVTHSTVGAAPEVHAFSMGAPDAIRIRRLLGEIATESPLRVEVTDWRPPLT